MTENSEIHSDSERLAFGAEVTRLLEILVHSVYADRDVFLRELISNAADACDKLRYLSLSDESLMASDTELGIQIVVDPDQRTIDVIDNGIGMSRDEMIENLGTIAKSGTRAFMEEAGEGGVAGTQIGQFGIGFYSAFIVASEVAVTSRRMGQDNTYVWRSDGTGSYTIEVAGSEETNFKSSTRVRLSLREGMDEFGAASNLINIIKAHSNHIAFPIDVLELKSGERAEPVRANVASALWAQPKADITKEQYGELFGALSGVFDEPAITIHYKAEGRHEYDVLLFVPVARPFDLFDPSHRSHLKLYVRRVLITDQAEILPSYLRFVCGVVDSADMPLTISRDMLQDNSVVALIKKAVTNRVFAALTKKADKDPAGFETLWDSFGAVLKEGLYEDYERRDELLELLRFKSTSGDSPRSLKDYVADLKENQTAIYFMVGEELSMLQASPQLEGFRARGVEVILLTDAVDNFWTQAVMGYNGKPFKSVKRSVEDLSNIARIDGDDSAGDNTEKPRASDVASLAAFLKQALGKNVSDVSISNRLVESAVCLVAGEGGLDRTLEKILGERQTLPKVAPVLEINPRHELIGELAELVVNGGGNGATETAYMLLDCALISEGEKPRDISEFATRLQSLMQKSLA